jgi:superfamily II DNA or RNA helicase
VDTASTLRALLSDAPDIPIHRSPLQVDLPGAPSASTSPPPPAGQWYLLGLRAFELALQGTSDHLIAPSVVADRVQPHPYQLQVVRQVLFEKMPAAILADEVGLGKTIEAGLILKELVLRGAVRSALIVAPKALLSQWQDELRERFDEEFVVTEERRFRGFDREDRVICSFQQLVRACDAVAARSWDCLIVDEAHLLANPDSKRRRCVGRLQTRWRLLLTATPVQNKITDLYSLIDLVAPGRLSTMRQFIAEYAADPATCRTVVPARAAALRSAAAAVMCRTRRAETAIAFAPRTVDTYLVAADEREAAVIGDVTNYLRALYRQLILVQPRQDATPAPSRSSGRARRAAAPRASAQHPQQPALTPAVPRGALLREIVALQQSLSSSPQAIAAALRARAERHPDERALLLELAARCGELRGAKEQLLLDALRTLGREPVLIFTLRLETARRLRDVIAAAGRSAACYIGALTGDERRSLVARFNRGALQTLIATDAGAEGLNLQERCHIVFNYDLHWNPMKMEQRIGRVHRLGQTRAVQVANFALQDTIDEYVLTLLYQKIDLFTMTIGAIESVLADLQEGELDLEERLLDILLQGPTDVAARAAVAALGDDMADALQRRHAAESLTAGVLG